MSQHNYVFICYSRKDGNRVAERLEQALQKRDFDTWRDIRGIDPAKDFTAEIENAIKDAMCVVVCITQDTQRQDSFVRREIQYALLAQKPVIVALFDTKAIPPIQIVNQTWFEFYSGWNKAFERLCSYISALTLKLESQNHITDSNDPFRPYLHDLYNRIVDFLDKTVITLIDLVAEETSGAVATQSQRRDMFDRYYVSYDTNDTTNGASIFSRFSDAYDYYQGRVLLLGSPGAGKSITLMSFCRDAVAARLTDSRYPIPFLGVIPTWDVEIQPQLSSWLSEGYRTLNIDDVVSALVQGNAILLLDGLDELGAVATRKIEVENEDTGKLEPKTERFDPREVFIDKLPMNNNIIVTCRVRDYAEIEKNVDLSGAVTLHPLSDAQMREYLKEQDDLLAAVEHDDELRNMLRAPLIMSLFAFAYRDQGEDARRLRDLRHSPSDLRAEIIGTYIRKRYRWDASKHNVSFTLEEITSTLGNLALENAAQRLTSENIFSESDISGDLIELITRLHIMISGIRGTYRFIHLLVRDYFVFIAAMPLLKSDVHQTRLRAATGLGRIADDRAVAALISALYDTVADVRKEIIYALVRIGSASVQPLLGKVTDQDKYVRRSAIEALGQLSDSRAIKMLIPALHDKEALNRRAVAEALGQIGGAQAVDVLILMLHDMDVRVRMSSVLALSSLGDVRAIEPLMKLILDNNTTIRRRIRNAVMKFGIEGEDAFVLALSNENPSARTYAIAALQKTRRDGLVQLLSPLLSDTENDRYDRRVCDVAAEALRYIGTREAMSLYRKWIGGQI